MSAGQCQRVATVRATMAEPALVVADEPTSGLDTVAAAGIARLLGQAVDRGTTVVVVSHDPVLLSSLCDRVLRMHDGVLAHPR
ncbi:hypothetical protein ACFXJ8_11650 [Nonomuraea sp. NPDC059194]|uniref:hypothetical protein n=1 Tax=Nonomuraea sp. NPDC059194 TaxID=3346764 RepID=UPI0036CD6257